MDYHAQPMAIITNMIAIYNVSYIAIGKAQAAYAQSFALWQQALKQQ